MAGLTVFKTKFYAGFVWLVEAARLFLKSPFMWFIIAIGLCLTITIFYGVWALFVTLLKAFSVSYTTAILMGLVVLWLLSFSLFGGLLLSAKALDKDNDLMAVNIFAGFKNKFRDLSVLSVCVLLLLIAFSFLISIILKVIASLIVAYFGMFGLVILESLALFFKFIHAVPFFIVFTIIWFAPALVVLIDQKPLAAIRNSLYIFRRNWFPLLLLWLPFGMPFIMKEFKWRQLLFKMGDAVFAFLGFSIGLLPIFFSLLVYISCRSIVDIQQNNGETR